MYDYLKGELISKSPTDVIMDVGGIGYRLEVSLRTSDKLPGPGGRLHLLVLHKVQDDRFRLFGFADQKERDLFRDLIGIAGVGPAHALALLSGLDPARIWQCIRDGDAVSLARTKGIGPKIAQRLCNELADKSTRQLAVASSAAESTVASPIQDDAVSALLVLGYNESQAYKAVTKALKSTGAKAKIQTVIREALQNS